MEEMVDYAGPREPPPKYAADPRSHKGGYSRLPMNDYPPEPRSAGYQPGSMGYQPYPPVQPMPAPVVQQQQSSNTNVVVVGQPQAQPQVVSVRTRQATTFVALTAVTMVLCLLHGNLPAFVCLIPALICACVASDHNDAGEYEDAKTCGNMSLFCNLCSMIYFVILFLAAIGLVVAIFVAGVHIFNVTTDIVSDTTTSLCQNGQICQYSGRSYQCLQC